MSSIELILEAKSHDLGGGFWVARSLPAAKRRMVGPFTFFDHMGPAQLAAGGGMDVRPHPHIHLATVTYLFEGAITHRDSLGSQQVIVPGDINWMNAGRGIVHSERTPPELRAQGSSVHGLQLWVALPQAQEDSEPTFRHYPSHTLPSLEVGGARVRVLAGQAFGHASPVQTHSPLFYVEAHLPAGAQLDMPEEHAERAAYVVSGEISCDEQRVGPRHMLVCSAASGIVLRAESEAHVMLLGGAALDGPRFMEWNFVSSDKARIEQAKRDWREGRFPKVPGDDVEFIPLP